MRSLNQKKPNQKKPMMPIHWKSNSRIKNLVPAANLVAPRTITADFPASAATIVMRDVRTAKPPFTIHICSAAIPYKMWNGSTGVSKRTLRVHYAPHPVGLDHLELNGYATTGYSEQIDQIIAHVKSIIHV